MTTILKFAGSEDITSVLRQYLPLRALYLDSNKELALPEILGEMWDQLGPEDKPTVANRFAYLVFAGEVPFKFSGHTADDQPVYVVTPGSLY